MIIKKYEGINFAKESGDTNKIHLDYLTGYNSQFGDNIVHGSYLLIKFLSSNKIVDFKSIKIKFLNGFFYNKPIKISKIKSSKFKETFKLTQNNEEKGQIEVLKKHIKEDEIKFKNKTFYKKFNINKKIKKFFKSKKIDNDLNLALNYLTKYTGMIYPGKNSLISEINIKKNMLSKYNDLEIHSTKPSLRHPIIYNKLYYESLIISFLTLVRPKLVIKNKKKNSYLSKLSKKINKNILIIGASNGIGNELFNLFEDIKKKKIISTYNHNKISSNKKNIIIKRIDIEKDLNKVFKIIKTYKPLIVYYFATPKININNKSSNYYNTYKKFYISIPIKLIKHCIKNKSYFFYPSTTYIHNIQKNFYSKTKKIAEGKIKKIKNNNLFVNILRIPEVNTKQNLSVFNKGLPNFTDLLMKYKDFRNKIFFKNLI